MGLSPVIDTQEELVVVHNMRRQHLARDLYVMAQTLADPLPASAMPEERAARARQLAQWAINAVDYRDPDNIMTAFEYDIDPFDGWAPEGNIASENEIDGGDNQLGTNDDVGGV